MELLERAHYIDQLSALLRATAGGSGRTILISGEAGIGKTILVERFVRQDCGEAICLWGACEALFTPRPLGPLYDIAVQVRGELLTLVRSDAEQAVLFSSLLDTLQRGSLPHVVVFEDVHWADEATLDLIKFLGRRISRLSALLLLTYREDELNRDHPLWSVVGDLPNHAVMRLRLAPLSEHAVRTLAQQARRSAEQLYAVTAGNPFFVTEVLASESDGVPPQVRDAVLARIARLSPDARTLLELISVIPSRAERWLVEEACDTVALEECCTCGMLELSAKTVAFRHELARQALESTLSPLRQRILHTQVLQALVKHGEDADYPARLVHHAVGAQDRMAVARYAPIAARQAATRGAHREAAAQYATALLYADQLSLEQQAALLEGRSYECYLTSQIEEAVQAREAALHIWRQLNHPEKIGQTLRWFSRLNWFLGKTNEAEHYAAEAVQLLETLPLSTGLAMAYSNRAQLAMLSHHLTEAIHWGQQAIELAEALGDIKTLVHALNNVGTAQLIAQQPEGCIHLERSLRLALERGWEEHVVRAYNNLVSCAIIMRDYALAERFWRAGLAYCSEHDLDSWEQYMRAGQARARFEQGAWSEAARLANSVLANPRTTTASRILALAVLGGVRIRRGDPDGMPVLDEALQLACAIGETQRIVPVAAMRAEASWLQGNREQALVETMANYNLVLRSQSPWGLGELSIWMWRAGGLQGTSGSIAEPFAHEVAGDWRGAADLWAQLGCPYEQALALAGGDSEAMLNAVTIFERLGAQPAAALVRRQLRQQGIAGIPRGPRPSTRTNQAGLTTRQVEVLRLMAEGLTNAEIARRLFTSPKTIDHHVSAILAKLEVPSRAKATITAFQMGILANVGGAESDMG